MDLTCTGDTRATHSSGNNSGVACHTSAACHNTLGDCHSSDILRRGLGSDKNDFLTFCSPFLSFLSCEDNLSAGSAGRGVKSVCQRLDVVFLDLCLVKDRSEELVELTCRNT